MRAQSAIEFLIIVSMLLLILGPLWVEVSTILRQQQDDLRVAYAKTAVSEIQRAADIVSIQGPPASIMVRVYIPTVVTGSTVAGKEIELTLKMANSTTDVVAQTRGPVAGSLPTIEGFYRITVKAENGYVNITY